jgi:O-antigen/teichoic acid export membrane protein
MWKKERGNLKTISLSGMKSVAKTYKSFPKFNFPASIVNSMSTQLPPLMLLALYDAKIVGFYALAYMVIVLPGGVISGSMGQAFLGEASKMIRDGSQELRSFYIKTTKHLTMIAVPLLGIPALCAPFIFPIIFGGAWTEAGWYCWPLAVMVIAQFVVSPISFLHIYGRNQWQLIWDITRVVGIILGFYVSHLLGFSVLITLLTYAVIMFLMYIVNALLVIKAISTMPEKSIL